MRPQVHVNCAISLDGFLGGPNRTPLRLSNAEDMRRVHALRAASDAILVGVGTVLADDPKLTVKWELLGRTGKSPLRVVLDSRLRTPPTALVCNEAAPTLFFASVARPGPAGREVEQVPAAGDVLDPASVLDRLGRRGIRTLMVEGGSRVITSFLRARLVDRLTLFIAPQVVADESAARLVGRPMDLGETLRLVSAAPLGSGILAEWQRA